MNVILLGANNPKLVGEVVSNLLAVGNAVEVTSEVIAHTLLARIEFKKPVDEETRALKAEWKEKLRVR